MTHNPELDKPDVTIMGKPGTYWMGLEKALQIIAFPERPLTTALEYFHVDVARMAMKGRGPRIWTPATGEGA